MKVNVDDIIVKSKTTEQHAANLIEVFNQLWKYNMILNFEICVWCQRWKILGLYAYPPQH